MSQGKIWDQGKLMFITVEFKFEAAHKLLHYNGPCEKLHGHSYLLHVSILGEVDANGFVMDFGELKKIVGASVISKLDHEYLNNIIEQPTAENTIVWVWEQLTKVSLPVYELKLWETASSYVTYRGEK